MNDYKFLFGDVSFKIDMFEPQIRQYLQLCEGYFKMNKLQRANDVIKSLIIYDEFFVSQNNCTYLNKYKESEISFMPTYKFDAFSTSYQTSSCPSWF